MHQPSIGRIVHSLCDKAQNNGTDVAPAIITRVWGKTKAAGHDAWTVNTRLVYDSDQIGWRSSVVLVADERTAREVREALNAPLMNVAFWPERVG